MRSYLHRGGLRYRLHARDLPGCLDVLLPRYRAAAFVQGCLWHQQRGVDCPHTGGSLTTRAYWEPKLARTRDRDAFRQAEVREMGWRVLVVWEHEIDDKHLATLISDVRGGSAHGEAT